MGFFDSGISEGLNQTTGNMVNMGMQLYQHKAQQAIQQERLRVEQETATRRNKLLDMQIAQQQDETKLIDVDDQLDRMGFKSPEEKKWWYSQPDIQLDIEDYGGRKTLQKKKAIDHFMNVAKQPEKNIELGNIRLGNYTKQIDGITQQISDPESKLKPDQIDALNKQVEVLKQARITTINQISQEQKKIKAKNYVAVGAGGLLNTETDEIIGGEKKEGAPSENKWIATINDPNATPEQKAIAQQNLDLEQKRKLELARAQGGVKQELENAGIDIPGIAEAVANGQDSRVAIKNTRGNNVATKVESEVLKKYPKFNFMMADANYKWKSSQTNMRTINFAQGSMQRVAALYQQVSQLPNASIPAINKIMREVSVNLGKPEYTNFESNRNAIVQEVNTALSGSATGSDLRVQIELENLKSARSPKQLQGAITNLYDALFARLDVDLSPIYPIEVVRGEVSMAQYKKELYAKYTKNYKPHNSTDLPAFDVKVPEGTKGFKWENGQLIPY